MNPEQTLANGEVWYYRQADDSWHMDLPPSQYAPVSNENFVSYAECIAASVLREAGA